MMLLEKLVMCALVGFFVLCVSANVVLCLGFCKFYFVKEKDKDVVLAEGEELPKVDKVLLKQWDNLLGYDALREDGLKDE